MLLKYYVQHYELYRYGFTVLQCGIIDKCKGRRKNLYAITMMRKKQDISNFITQEQIVNSTLTHNA